MFKWLLSVLGLILVLSGWAQTPVISFITDSISLSEGAGTYSIAVGISSTSSVPVSVDINALSGNAVNGVNFTYSPVTITFPANVPYDQFINVTILDDSVPDGNKQVNFTLANPVNGTLDTSDRYALLMIDDDTPQIAVSPAAQTINESAGQVNIGLTLNRGVRNNTSVQAYLIAQGTTAVPGVDFVFTDTTLTWPPDSDGPLILPVGIIYNQFYEPQRTIKLGLRANNNGVLSDTTVTITLLANPGFTQPGCSDLLFGQYVQGTSNNQALQIYNPTNVTINLGVYSIIKSVNGGTTVSVFNFNPGDSIGPFGVYVAANAGAEQSILNVADTVSSFFSFDGTDAFALMHLTDTLDVIGQLNVNPGPSGWSVNGGSTVQQTLIRNYYTHAGSANWDSTSGTWNVYPVNLVDSLGFHHAEACNGGAPVATLNFLYSRDTIYQDDTTVWVSVAVNNPTGANINWTFAYGANSTAVEGYANDFVMTNSSVTSPPGYSLDSFYIFVFGTSELTPVKTIVFECENYASNVKVIPDTSFILYLVENNKFKVSFLGAGYSYPQGSGWVSIPLVLSTTSSQPTSADVTLSNGNAVLGQDFQFSDTTITFPAFSSDTQAAWVNILPNNNYEGNKQINFNLSNATNGAIVNIAGFTLTIINNDSLAGGVAVNEIDKKIDLMPNPVTNMLFINAATNLNAVEITDMLGKRISVLGEIKKGMSSVNVSSLATGTYFLKANADNVPYCRKFIKAD